MSPASASLQVIVAVAVTVDPPSTSVATVSFGCSGSGADGVTANCHSYVATSAAWAEKSTAALPGASRTEDPLRHAPPSPE